MDKIWFVDVNGKQEGPFSIQELKSLTAITPDTLVWREGFDQWRAIRKVHELEDLFKDEQDSEEDDSEENKLNPKKIPDDDELALSLPGEFPPVIWLMLILLALSYLMYYFFGHNE